MSQSPPFAPTVHVEASAYRAIEPTSNYY